MIGYIWDHLHFLSLCCMIIAFVFQGRAIYLKKIMVNEYGFLFPPSFLGMVGIHELKANRSQANSEDLKEIITSFIISKKWFYIFLIVSVVVFAGPHFLKWWISDGKRI
jgi:hypothetical protein